MSDFDKVVGVILFLLLFEGVGKYLRWASKQSAKKWWGENGWGDYSVDYPDDIDDYLRGI